MDVLLVALFGLVIGSFLNVLADRLPKGQDVFLGRSHCDFCKKNLRWFELIPVISFFSCGARCLRCHKRLSWQYPLSELVTATGFIVLYRVFGMHAAELAASLVIFSSLLVVTLADLKYQIIPDSMIVTSLVGAIAWLYVHVPPAMWLAHGLSGIAACALFYMLWYGTKGKGMGFGDVKLSFVLGLLLGFPGTIFALYIAFLTGAGVGVILILGGSKTLKSKIAFGPFLILGILGTAMWYSELLLVWKRYF